MCHWTNSLGRSKHAHRVNISNKHIRHVLLAFGSDVPMCHCEMHLDESALEYLTILAGLYQPPMHVKRLEIVDTVSFLHQCQGCLHTVIISWPPCNGELFGQLCCKYQSVYAISEKDVMTYLHHWRVYTMRIYSNSHMTLP